MKNAILLIVFFSTASLGHSQSDRLQNLKDQKDSAIERANAPINARYVSELRKLLKISTASGQLEEAIKIKAEIALFEKKSPNDSKTAAKKEFTENYLVGTNWEQGEVSVLKFEKGRFRVYKKDKDGKFVGGDYRNWEILDVAKRKIKIFWHWGEDTATLNRKLTEIKGSKAVLKLIED